MGRRYAALVGIAIVAVGTAFESGATGPGAYSMMIAGRIISGIGTGLVSTCVPLYQRFDLFYVQHRFLVKNYQVVGGDQGCRFTRCPSCIHGV